MVQEVLELAGTEVEPPRHEEVSERALAKVSESDGLRPFFPKLRSRERDQGRCFSSSGKCPEDELGVIDIDEPP